jgi:flagellar basal body-associated protein FliL
MATVSFTLPMNPVMISAAKKKGSILGLVLNVVILVALAAFIWWFYKAMQKSATPPPPPLPVVAAEAALTPAVVEAAPEGVGASVGVQSAEV